MKGAAGTWLSNKRIGNANWPTQWNPANAADAGHQAASFTYQFKEQFRTADRIYEWQQQLNDRQQLPNETVEQYAAAIRELLRRIDPTDQYPNILKVQLFVKGLRPEI